MTRSEALPGPLLIPYGRNAPRVESSAWIAPGATLIGDHVLVFVRLGALYKSAGNKKRARAVWEQGRLRFPDEKQLEDALEMIGEEE